MIPFFSIVIPTYNRAHLIAETIDSILNQDYKEFELIIVDDGSKDNTEEVVKKYTDSRIHYFYKANEERGAARNFGMREAKGAYALFFDSDDWMHSNHLSTLKEYIDRNPSEYNFIASKYQLKEENGNLLPGGSAHMKEGWYSLDTLLRGNSFGCLYAVNMKNEKLCFFEEDRSYATLEDWMFLLQNLKFHNIYLVNRVTITVRHHDGQSMANNEKVINARKKATAWALKNLNLSREQERKLNGYSSYFCGIHQYLECNKRLALTEAWKAISYVGIKYPFLILFIKAIVGKKWIEKIKG